MKASFLGLFETNFTGHFCKLFLLGIATSAGKEDDADDGRRGRRVVPVVHVVPVVPLKNKHYKLLSFKVDDGRPRRPRGGRPSSVVRRPSSSGGNSNALNFY